MGEPEPEFGPPPVCSPGHAGDQDARHVQAFIDAPGEQDVAVDTVFTPEMFAQLAEDMAGVGMDGVEPILSRKQFAELSPGQAEVG